MGFVFNPVKPAYQNQNDNGYLNAADDYFKEMQLLEWYEKYSKEKEGEEKDAST